MKKVLQVFGDMNCGGAENFIMNMFRNIEDVQFDFLCCVNDINKNADYDNEIKLLNGNIFKIKKVSLININKHIKEIKKIITENGPYEAIHIHTLLHSGIVAYAAKKAGIKKIVIHSHSTNQGKKNNLYRKIYEKVSINLINKYGTHFLACGIDAGNYLFKNKFEIFKNGIEINKFLKYDQTKIEELIKKYNLKDKVIVGQVGRLVDVKNHKFTIEIAKKTKNIVYIIVGTGPLEENLKSEVKKYKLEDKFIFTGLSKDISSWMSIFDLLIMPSLYEGFPLTLVECQASGTKALISNNIDKTVDLGLNLIDFEELDLNKWLKKINKINKKQVTNEMRHKINLVLKEKGYDAKENAKKLKQIYFS